MDRGRLFLLDRIRISSDLPMALQSRMLWHEDCSYNTGQNVLLRLIGWNCPQSQIENMAWQEGLLSGGKMVTFSLSNENHRESFGLRKLDELREDLRYARRQLARSPIFTVMAALTLAIGVAANSTTFGLIDALMFRPPAHVRDPERVGRITDCSTYFQYQTLHESAKTIDVAAFRSSRATYGRGAGAEEIPVQCVTHRYFPLLGATPIVGRVFSQSEDTRSSSDFVAMIGYDFWRAQFQID